MDSKAVLNMHMAKAAVGDWSVDLAPAYVLDALFATISLRLEPNGWASRFPVVLDHVEAGRIEPARADMALNELRTIARELADVPVDRIVWGRNDSRSRDDTAQPVNRGARNACEYFVGADRRPILDSLSDAVAQCRSSGQPLIVTSTHRQMTLFRGMCTIGIGVVWGILAYVFFPTLMLVSIHEKEGHGIAVWPVGFVFMAIGIAMLMVARSPSWGLWAKRHQSVTGAFIAASFALFMYLDWR